MCDVLYASLVGELSLFNVLKMEWLCAYIYMCVCVYVSVSVCLSASVSLCDPQARYSHKYPKKRTI